MKKILTVVLLLTVALGIFTGCSDKSKSMSKIFEIQDLFDERKYEDALELANKYTEEYPDHHLGWSKLGWINVKLDEYETAIENFNKAVELQDDYENTYVGLGVAHKRLGNLDKARECYLKALEIDSDDAYAYSSLSVLELQLQNYDDAVKYAEQAWENCDKEDAAIAANNSIIYFYARDNEKRDEYYNHAKELKYASLEVLDKLFNGEVTLDYKFKEE